MKRIREECGNLESSPKLWGIKLEHRLCQLKLGQATIPEPEDVRLTMDAIVLLMEALRNPLDVGFCPTNREHKMGVMALLMDPWSWGVIEILGLNSRLFKEMQATMKTFASPSEDDFFSLWLQRTSCPLPEDAEVPQVDEEVISEISIEDVPSQFRARLEEGIELSRLLPRLSRLPRKLWNCCGNTILLTKVKRTRTFF